MSQLDHFSTATVMLAALDARDVTSVELVEMHIERIEATDADLNVIAISTFDRAREAAAAADAARGGRRSVTTPRTADDAEGVDSSRGARRSQPACRRSRRTCRWPTDSSRDSGVRCRRMSARQDQHPVRAGRLAGRQPDLRPHEQSMGPRTIAWREYRWWRGRARGRADAAGDRQRHRRLDPCASRVLRGVRPSADRDGDPALGFVPHGRPDNPATIMGVQGPLARSASDLELLFDVVAGPVAREDEGGGSKMPPARHDRLADFRVAIMPPTHLGDAVGRDAGAVDGLAGFLSDRERPSPRRCPASTRTPTSTTT